MAAVIDMGEVDEIHSKEETIKDGIILNGDTSSVKSNDEDNETEPSEEVMEVDEGQEESDENDTEVASLGNDIEGTPSIENDVEATSIEIDDEDSNESVTAVNSNLDVNDKDADEVEIHSVDNSDDDIDEIVDEDVVEQIDDHDDVHIISEENDALEDGVKSDDCVIEDDGPVKRHDSIVLNDSGDGDVEIIESSLPKENGKSFSPESREPHKIDDDDDDDIITLDTPVKKVQVPVESPRRSARNLNRSVRKCYIEKDRDDSSEEEGRLRIKLREAAVDEDEEEEEEESDIEEVLPQDPLACGDPLSTHERPVHVKKIHVPTKTKVVSVAGGSGGGSASTIVVKDTKRLVEIASKSSPNSYGKKEPTLVIIDTNSILSGRGPIPIHQKSNAVTASSSSTSSSISHSLSQSYPVLPLALPAQGVYPPNMRATITPIPPMSSSAVAATHHHLQTKSSSMNVVSASQLQSAQLSHATQISLASSAAQQSTPAAQSQQTAAQSQQQQQPAILPSLTDDMFVVEAPSFIVPYVYEKPPVKDLKDFVQHFAMELRQRRANEEKERVLAAAAAAAAEEEKERQEEKEKERQEEIEKERQEEIEKEKQEEKEKERQEEKEKERQEEKEKERQEEKEKERQEEKEKEREEEKEKLAAATEEQKQEGDESAKGSEEEKEGDKQEKKADDDEEVKTSGDEEKPQTNEEVKEDKEQKEVDEKGGDEKAEEAATVVDLDEEKPPTKDDKETKTKTTEAEDTDATVKEPPKPPEKKDPVIRVDDIEEEPVQQQPPPPPQIQPSTRKQPYSYFDSPLGKFFIDIGHSLVQEFVQTDLLKQQKRKREREGGKNIETNKTISSLIKNLEYTKENNEPYHMPMKKCEFCSFKTESALAMAFHLETPHMKNFVYRCNFCPYEIRSPHDILFHMEAEHMIRGRLERAPAFHQCPNCPFEDNQKGKLSRHMVACSRKFKPDRNLEPPLEWEPPAKIPRVPRMKQSNLTSTAAMYQAMTKSTQYQLMQKMQSAQSALNRGRGRPSLGVTVKQPTMMRTSASMIYKSAMSGGSVLLPTNYQLSGNQLYQVVGGQDMGGRIGTGAPMTLLPNISSATSTLTIQQGPQQNKSKPMHQPSISITPLPRNTSAPQAPASKPGDSNSKNSFVICEICDGYIKDLEQLRNHMQWIHKVKIHPKMIYNRPPLNCQKCQFRFFTDQGLERHLLGSHGLVTSSMQEAANKSKDSGRCPVCGRVYQWKLLNHVARDHNMTLKPAHLSYKCTVCTATFGMYKQFENHVYSAHSVVAKRVMDKKSAAAAGVSSTSQTSSNNSGAAASAAAKTNDSLLKPLKINDEITIIPQMPKAAVGSSSGKGGEEGGSTITMAKNSISVTTAPSTSKSELSRAERLARRKTSSVGADN